MNTTTDDDIEDGRGHKCLSTEEIYDVDDCKTVLTEAKDENTNRWTHIQAATGVGKTRPATSACSTTGPISIAADGCTFLGRTKR
jgi:hypothetical protein